MEDIFKVAILSLIQGVTEFLPVSSTGHLIVGAAVLRFDALLPPIFEIFIQIGAVVAVLVYYRRLLGEQILSLRSSSDARRFWLMIALASAPVAALGIIYQQEIEALFFSPQVVAASLIFGGIAILFVERLPRFQDGFTDGPLDLGKVTISGGAHRVRASTRAHSGHVALGQLDRGWHASRLEPPVRN